MKKVKQGFFVIMVIVCLMIAGCGGGDGNDEETGGGQQPTGDGQQPTGGGQQPRFAGRYSLTIVGTVAGQQFQAPLPPPFRREPARLFVRDSTITAQTTNGSNPIEVLLNYGSPSTVSLLGTINFATNLALSPGSAVQADIAFVDFDPAALTVVVRPDPRAQGAAFNQFAETGGITPNILTIQSGFMQIQFQDNGNTIVGQIDVIGNGQILLATERYIAQFRGTAGGTDCL